MAVPFLENEREPVFKAIADFADEFLDLHFQILSVDPILQHFGGIIEQWWDPGGLRE